MRRLRLFALLTLSIAAALAISACGGDDDDGGGGEDEAEITEVIETSVVSTDPADCTRLQTQRFVEQIQFRSGEEALAQCEEAAADTAEDPDSIEVSDVEVTGSAATADVSFVGGTFDGSTLALGLVKEGEQWKVDAITDIPEFNFDAFQTAFSEQLTTQGQVSAETASCITDSFAAAGPEAVKSALISGDEAELSGLFGECLAGG